MKYIKDERGRVFLRQEDIKTRWLQYFSQLLNESRGSREEDKQLSNVQRPLEDGLTSDITTEEVGQALKKMGRTKTVWQDNIPIEVWRGLGEEGIRWLTNLFNTILRTHRMLEEWRNNTLIPLFKNKGVAQVCGNYRGTSLIRF